MRLMPIHDTAVSLPQRLRDMVLELNRWPGTIHPGTIHPGTIHPGKINDGWLTLV
jgi:hypothetical protein